MRILNITESYAPFLEFGGPPTKVRALSEGLAKRGHAVTVLTADWGLRKRIHGTEMEKQVSQSPFGLRWDANGVRAIYLPSWWKYRALTWNPALGRYLRARLSEFDVAHIFGLYDFLGPATAKACRKWKVPYVVEPIGMFVPIVRNVRLKRWYHALWGRKMLQGAGTVVATSEQEVEEIAGGGLPRAKIALRRNGVEIPEKKIEKGKFRKELGISAEAALILFLGRISKKKSPDLLLSAFARLTEDALRKEAHLAFVGPDESGMKGQLARMARERGAERRVHFHEGLFGEEKWQAYGDADVFVLPSQNENFGNTAAESIGMGTPAIVTERCGVAPLLKDKAGLVVKHDKAELADAIRRVLSEPGLREKLSSGCPEVARQLGWEEPVLAMEQLYGGLIARRAAAGDRQPQG